jgi:hypothetical protein
MGSIHEKKTWEQKSRATVPLKRIALQQLMLRMQVFTKNCLNRKERKHNFFKSKKSSK